MVQLSGNIQKDFWPEVKILTPPLDACTVHPMRFCVELSNTLYASIFFSFFPSIFYFKI